MTYEDYRQQYGDALERARAMLDDALAAMEDMYEAGTRHWYSLDARKVSDLMTAMEKELGL